MKICLIGKPGTGKSTLLSLFAQKKCNVFEADKYVKEIYLPDKIGFETIKKEFGPEFCDNKTGVIKPKLGQLVFNDKKQLEKLNKLINPLIAKKIKELDQKKDWIIELGTYIYYNDFFKNIFDKKIMVISNKNFNNIAKSKKFFYLKKLPTLFVDNCQKHSDFIFNINNICKETSNFNVDFVVDNSTSKKMLKNNFEKLYKKIFY